MNLVGNRLPARGEVINKITFLKDGLVEILRGIVNNNATESTQGMAMVAFQ